jgi:two-component system, sensor histidine kinase and response regulator
MNGAGAGPTFKLVEVDLPMLVDRVCTYYRRLATRKQIAIEFRSAANTPHVWVDRVALAAVLDNLLSNAVKYSPPGKTVRVEVGPEDGSVTCRVQDEGPGLTEADQARLFQRGVRLSATPTGGEPSTGYGLAVAKDLATRMGGDLRCESRPGNGACFAVRLPVASGGAPASAPAKPRFTIPIRDEGS